MANKQEGNYSRITSATALLIFPGLFIAVLYWSGALEIQEWAKVSTPENGELTWGWLAWLFGALAATAVFAIISANKGWFEFSDNDEEEK